MQFYIEEFLKYKRQSGLRDAKINTDIDGEVLRTGEPVKGYKNYYAGSNKKKPKLFII